MAAILSVSEDRRLRNIVLGALLTLITIWIIRLSTTTTTLSSVSSSITTHLAHTNTSSPSQASTSAAALSKPAPKAGLHSDGPWNGTIHDKVAVIIEDRARINLIPLILHFSAVLGPSWPIIIYTSASNVGIFSSSAPLKRYLVAGIVSIRILPPTILFTNSDSVSRFMTKPWLWEQLAPAEHILVFQSDSMLCSNAALSVEDFFEWDFVGAPIAPHLGAGMNGGLSLRRRESFLRVAREWDWELNMGSRFEDRWFYDRFLEIQARESLADLATATANANANANINTTAMALAPTSPPIRIPPLEVARTFSVETIDYPHPLGVHQVHRWLGKQMVDLDVWCPEWKLCSGEYVKDTPAP